MLFTYLLVGQSRKFVFRLRTKVVDVCNVFNN